MTERRRPKFSILHPTIRLANEGWRSAWECWADTCDQAEAVEYILAIDDWGNRPFYFPWWTSTRHRSITSVIVLNNGRCCYVDAQNTAAKAARGDFLITAADDWFPCLHWDSMLNALVPDPLHTEAVIKVRTQHHPDLAIYPILTRAYYERPGRGGCPAGELFYPEYLSMGSDDDLTEYARRDGVLLEAPEMKFEHRHHSLGLAQEDEAYRYVASEEAWAVKERVIARRRRENYSR